MVRGRSGVVDGSWLVSRCWCRLVGFVFGFTRVLDISDVSTISIINLVSDSLDSAIGKGNSVASRGSISITSFSLAKVYSRVVILGSIGVVVDRGSIRVDRGFTIGWGRGMVRERGRWGGHSSGNKGSESNNGLKYNDQNSFYSFNYYLKGIIDLVLQKSQELYVIARKFKFYHNRQNAF